MRTVAVKADVVGAKLRFAPRHGLGVVPGPDRKVLVNEGDDAVVARRRVGREVSEFGHQRDRAAVDEVDNALNEMINTTMVVQIAPCESVGTRFNRLRACNISNPPPDCWCRPRRQLRTAQDSWSTVRDLPPRYGTTATSWMTKRLESPFYGSRVRKIRRNEKRRVNPLD